MFSLFTYRQSGVQEIESRANELWGECFEQIPKGEVEQGLGDNEKFWKNYHQLIQQARKEQPIKRVVYATQATTEDKFPIYSFSELGRLHAIGSGALFSFGFFFLFLAILGKGVDNESFSCWLLLPFSLLVGVFFARSFKTCSITSNTLIIHNPWLFMHRRFSLHQINSVTIDNNPNGYWFLQIETPQKQYKYSVNINYCKLKQLLDLLGENHITTYDKISLLA